MTVKSREGRLIQWGYIEKSYNYMGPVISPDPDCVFRVLHALLF